MASFQHLRPAGDLSPAQHPGRSSLRQTIALGLLAAIFGLLALAGVRAVQPGGVAPRPLAAALGARQPDASLTKRPATDVRVRIGRREVSVTRSGVTPAKTEQFLTVDSRQGARPWRRRLGAGHKVPRVGADGAVAFLSNHELSAMYIEPARQAITPPVPTLPAPVAPIPAQPTARPAAHTVPPPAAPQVSAKPTREADEKVKPLETSGTGYSGSKSHRTVGLAIAILGLGAALALLLEIELGRILASPRR